MTTWRKSSFTDNGQCVELAEVDTGVLVRNSNHPDAGTLQFTRSEMAAWIEACKAGEFDDLTPQLRPASDRRGRHALM